MWEEWGERERDKEWACDMWEAWGERERQNGRVTCAKNGGRERETRNGSVTSGKNGTRERQAPSRRKEHLHDMWGNWSVAYGKNGSCEDSRARLRFSCEASFFVRGFVLRARLRVSIVLRTWPNFLKPLATWRRSSSRASGSVPIEAWSSLQSRIAARAWGG